MSKKEETNEIVPPHMIELMAKYGIKSPRVDALELIDLLIDLSEIDLPLAMMDRVNAAKHALMGQSRGGKIGGRTRALEDQSNPSLINKKILVAATEYKGDRRNRAKSIAKKLRLSSENAPSYVRKVLKKAGL